MIVYNNNSGWTAVYLGNQPISKVHSSLAQVWPENEQGFRYKLYGQNGNVLKVGYCNSSSAVTSGEVQDYKYSTYSIEIGDCCTEIGQDAFYHFDNLTSVTISESIQNIGQSAFFECSSLLSTTILATTPPTLGSAAFSNTTTWFYVPCECITDYQAAWDIMAGKVRPIPDSCHNLYLIWGKDPLYGPQVLVDKPCGTSSTITSNDVVAYKTSGIAVDIGDCCTAIGNSAFSGWTKLSSVTLSDSITSMGIRAFSGCTALTEIYIPSGITSVGQSAFAGCKSLTSVTFEDGLVRIYESAFAGCTKLTNIVFPSSMTSIRAASFSECTSLTSVTYAQGSQIDYVTNNLYNSCVSLQRIVLPNTVKTIGTSAFAGSGLITIEIPAAVSGIQGSAFANCTGLTSITCLATTPPTLGNNAFYNTADAPIYVPSGSVSAYLQASGWSTYASRIQAIPTD